MKKNVAIIIGIAVLALIIGLVFFLLRNNFSFEENSPVSAIPEDAEILFHINNPAQFSEALLNASFSNDIEKFESFMPFKEFGAFLDTSFFFRDVINLKSKKRPVIISIHRDKENGKTSWLFGSSIKSKQEEKDILKIINKMQPDEKQNKTKNTYFALSKNSFIPVSVYVSCEGGILSISNSESLIKESGNQKQSGKSLLNNSAFSGIFKEASQTGIASVYVNLGTINKFVSPLLTSDAQNIADSPPGFGEWCELDVEINKDVISLNGFLVGNQNKLFPALFKGINPQSPDVYQIAPLETKFLMSYSFDSRDRFKENLISYLEQNVNYLEETKSFKEKYNTGIEEFFFSFIEKEVSLVYTKESKDKSPAKFLIFNTEGQSKTLEAFSLANSGKMLLPTDRIVLDNQTEISVYNGIITSEMKSMWGNLFPDVPCNVFAFYRNYLIFSENKESLKSFMYSAILNKNFASYPYFTSFSENFSYHENFFMFVEIPEIYSLTKENLNPEVFHPTNEQENALDRFYGLGVQLSSSGNLLYTTIVANHTPNRDEEPKTIWQSRLDSIIVGKPFIVDNHNTGEKEIIVQDAWNNIYLINNMGRVLWKKPLDGAIMGDIFQIDFYKNNKLQYLFNTSNRMYLIDRNGNHVAKYPLSFPEKATNGLSVFDYENNKDYRIFVALADNRIYLFDKTGNRNPGWNFPQTEGTVSTPVQFITTQGKDYVVFSDQFKNYILDRRGETRVKPNRSFVRNSRSQFFADGNNLVTTTKDGELAKIDLSSGNCTVSKMFNISGEHFFTLLKYDSGKSSYILVTRNNFRIFDNSGKEELNLPFDEPIKIHTDIYRFSANDIKFGIVEEKGNKIHLLDKDGKNYRGFPLKGNSRFSIGFLKSSSYRFNLIVGGEHNFLNNYAVE